MNISEFFRYVRFYKFSIFKKIFDSIIKVFPWRSEIAYMFDLSSREQLEGSSFAETAEVLRYKKFSDIPKDEMESVLEFKINRDSFKKKVLHYFDSGATLWLVKNGDAVVSCGWAVRGDRADITGLPFLLCDQDAACFAMETFKPFRGKGFNKEISKKIYLDLFDEGVTRIYVSMAIWNKANQRSWEKMGAKLIARFWSKRILGCRIVIPKKN